jgi:hypothetical protein
MRGGSPQALGDSVRPRRLSGGVVRLLNFTVRLHFFLRIVTRHMNNAG